MHSEESFIAAVTQHQGIIHKVCHLYLQDPNMREDLFQEIMLNAWKSMAHFKGDAKFSTWLYRVALNTAVSWYRKNKRNPLARSTSTIPNNQSLPTSNEQEQLTALYKCIAMFSGINKAVILLYLEEYSYEEIGQIIGISANYVAVKMARIKKELAAMSDLIASV
jgi:RNA polymerase sigma-70 factor, ECF subfamily